MTSPGDPLAILDEICRDSLESSLASVTGDRAYSETQETSALFLEMHDAVAALLARLESAERERDEAGDWADDAAEFGKRALAAGERVKVLEAALGSADRLAKAAAQYLDTGRGDLDGALDAYFLHNERRGVDERPRDRPR